MTRRKQAGSALEAWDAEVQPADAASAYDAAIEPAGFDEPPDMPIQPLGLWGDVYFFIDAKGQQVRRTATQMVNKGALIGLFHGDLTWPEVAAPKMDQEGNPVPGAVHYDRLGFLLMRACKRRPLFNPDTPLRGVGVWATGEGVLVHLGDRILDLATGQRLEPGFARGGAIWPAWPARPAPAPPASVEVGRALVGRLTQWNWEAVEGPEARALVAVPAAARMLAGYVVAAMLGAAIPWRPHVLVVAQGGSGKTTLIEFLEALLPMAAAKNDYTEAGLRQMLSGNAGGLLLDEADASPAAMERLQRVIDMLRRASGGAGARSVRGSPGGASQTFEVTVSALLGSVHAPPLQPADASRFTRLDLRERREDSPLLDKAGLMAWAMDHRAALFGRALARHGAFLNALERFRATMTGPLWRAAPRQADQVGSLLAGWWILTQDGLPDDAAIADALDELGDLLRVDGDQAHEQGPLLALAQLLGSSSNVTMAGERVTIGYLVDEAQSDPNGSSLRRLREHGLAWITLPPSEVERALATAALDPRREPIRGQRTEDWINRPGLFIASGHAQLAQVYRGTPWEGGKWSDDFRRLPGAIGPRSPIRTGAAVKWRGVWLPAPLLDQAGPD